MVKIKGPIKISGGFNARKFLEENTKDLKIKLPFTATGWKSTKMPKNADYSNLELIKEKPQKVKVKKSKRSKK